MLWEGRVAKGWGLTLSQFRALEYEERVEMAANDEAWALMGAYETQLAEKKAKQQAMRQKAHYARTNRSTKRS